MNYEIMVNGNVRIGEMAPEFEAQTTLFLQNYPLDNFDRIIEFMLL